MKAPAALGIELMERGWLPDPVVRRGIRHLLRQRLAELHIDDSEARATAERRFIARMDGSPLAPLPEKANEQHYEVPVEFFALVLGRHRKYSSCYWRPGVSDLDEAEADALALTVEHAGIDDGMRILELGCGWGSLTLWVAERFPASHVTALSNSRLQKQYIDGEAARRGLGNVEVLTADMNAFHIDRQFDRVVSVEMFEHMRNYRALFERIAGWLRPEGRFFMHIFCHRSTPYEFVDAGASDWMSRHFFSGGMMPSDTLPLNFQDRLKLVDRWRWDGTHYERTANAWLGNLDRHRHRVEHVLAQTYGHEHVQRWRSRWRIFFMACAELFGYDAGQQWWVSHYLFERPAHPR